VNSSSENPLLTRRVALDGIFNGLLNTPKRRMVLYFYLGAGLWNERLDDSAGIACLA
jgi:hypothetical protein